MSKHSYRSSRRLQLIAPGPISEEGGKAGLSTGMKAKVDRRVASKTALRPPTKRRAVVSVACGHCQKQKSKCDGVRPMCGPCGRKGRRDCGYEVPRNQRRSAFMREMIEDFKRETAELRDIIRGICLAEDREAAVETVHMLVNTDFQKIREVAQLLRPSDSLPSFATPGFRRDLELQSLQDRTSSIPLPYDLSRPPNVPLSYLSVMPQLPAMPHLSVLPHLTAMPPHLTAMPQHDYLPFQMANVNYVPVAAPSSSGRGGYWTSSMDSPFSAQDSDFPSWPPIRP